MVAWRFDQGRLDYFQVDEIKKIARALSMLNGVVKPGRRDPDLVRDKLKDYSNLPFKPDEYYVWRNYGRVFECMILATTVDEHIVATELCQTIANNPDGFDSDDYLAHFARNFYYPSPIFSGYENTGIQIFPVIAVVKFLISQYLDKGKDFITIDDIGQYLVANKATGLEDIEYFSSMKKGMLPEAEELRQVRELVKVISQFSFLTWDNPNLSLDVSNLEELQRIEKILQPVLNLRMLDPSEEILQMGKASSFSGLGEHTLKNVVSYEDEFTEGRKVRVAHLRAERSSKLKDLYFKSCKEPQICRMCNMDTSIKYPWVPRVIELHHLLPLASPIRVESGKTSIKDLVGLCPTCHSATHRYYAQWFKKNNVDDFSDYAQAVEVYEEAKSKIVSA